MKGKRGIERDFVLNFIIVLIVLAIIVGGIWMIKTGKLDHIGSIIKNILRMGRRIGGIS